MHIMVPSLLVTSVTSAFAFSVPVQHVGRRVGGVAVLLQAAGISNGAEPFWETRTDCWRPTVNDVDRISWGKPAKKKGTGSRGVPHRLNQDERDSFDRARRKGFLEVNGSAWRAERRGAPLLNSYRSLCDAHGQACIVLHKGNDGSDHIVLDLSPLRLPERFASVAQTCEAAMGIPALIESAENDMQTEEEANNTKEDSGEIEDQELEDPWETRPIYQLSPFYVAWELPRSEAKATGKKLANMFHTMELQAAKSKKPVGVKHGKGRRHGGYGIG
jgi:hypothetical protein